MISNSEAVKAQISRLRKERRAANGIAERAYESSLDLRRKSERNRSLANSLAIQIEALGGKVRR